MNVVPLLVFFEDGDHLSLVMPRYACSLLDAIKKANGPLNEPTAIKIAVDLFTGLQGLHARRIVHRVGLCFELKVSADCFYHTCPNTSFSLSLHLLINRSDFLNFVFRTSSQTMSCWMRKESPLWPTLAFPKSCKAHS